MNFLLQVGLCTAVIDGLKVSHTGIKLIDHCVRSPDANVIKPWRARALCKEDQVVDLGEYLQAASRLEKLDKDQSENFEIQEGRGRRRRRGSKTPAPTPPPPIEGTQVFMGKFCGQGKNKGGMGGGVPLSTNVYEYTNTTTKSVDIVFKTVGSLCYNAKCTGNCDKDLKEGIGRADKSAQFKCVGAETVATWFQKANCEIVAATAGTVTGGVFVQWDFSADDEKLKVVIDGSPAEITLDTNCDTASNCATELTRQISGAKVAVVGDKLQITSESKGDSSTVVITDDGSGDHAKALFGSVGTRVTNDGEVYSNEYTYTAEEVTELNSGTQGRYCWATKNSKVKGDFQNGRVKTNPKWVPIETDPTTGKDSYYYSYVSTQKLPVCTV